MCIFSFPPPSSFFSGCFPWLGEEEGQVGLLPGTWPEQLTRPSRQYELKGRNSSLWTEELPVKVFRGKFYHSGNSTSSWRGLPWLFRVYLSVMVTLINALNSHFNSKNIHF